jgi:hypothetical protein
MWARVKGRTENAVLELFPNSYAFRPGFIPPTFGATSKTRLYRVLYAVTAPLTPVLQRWFPGSMVTTDGLGRAMQPGQAIRSGSSPTPTYVERPLIEPGEQCTELPYQRHYFARP